jgi:poly-gamma-glutamate synthesis protein (capsule biosynthesis protein)
MRPRLDVADLFIGNLESPLSAARGSGSWERVYRGPAEAAPALRVGRQTVMALANNHILEHGSALVTETRSLLSAAGVQPVGYESDGSTDRAALEVRIDGVGVQILAASLIRDLTGRAVEPEAQEARLVRQLRGSAADLRIVTLHWGDEYSTLPSAKQRQLARNLADAGAHLILGHHPHVLQPVERIGDALVAYSLGNFVFDQDWTDDTRTGGILEVRLDAGGVREWEFVPTICGRDCRPRPATGAAAERARRIIGRSCLEDEGTYFRALAAARRRHRLTMKAELVRHFPLVSSDTWHFLLTKRKRPRPELSSAGSVEP